LVSTAACSLLILTSTALDASTICHALPPDCLTTAASLLMLSHHMPFVVSTDRYNYRPTKTKQLND
jgi:hypothetical protein